MGNTASRPVFSVLAWVAVPGALVACFFAWLTRRAVCEDGCPAHIRPIFDLQLIVAIAGLLPVLVLVYATVSWRPKTAAVALVVGLAIYAGWGVLNNLAVHGSAFGG